MSGADVAALIVAVFWGVLVCFLAFVLAKLGGVIGEASGLVRGITEQTVPLLGEVKSTVSHLNGELARVDTITSHVQEISSNVSAMSSLVSVTVGNPLIKVAAFSYGVRRAIAGRRAAEVEKRVNRELRDTRRAARRRRRAS
ncbi:MAG: DUF948 domain-containing protein [Mycobacteriales bacterium]